MTFFKTGKLPLKFLDSLLKKIELRDPRIVVGPKIGEDATVLDMGDKYLVAKTDPITFTEDRIGWYCVNINANDVVTMGAEPRWFLATLLLPQDKTDENLVEKIFDDIQQSCQELEITLCGGHTEITYRLDRPILVGQMLGEVSRDRLITAERIIPGDVILLTQGIAIEGTAILASEKKEVMCDKVKPELLTRAERFLLNPGISVVKAALTAHNTADIHGMHDPTEGGIATGLWELAQICGHGLKINSDNVTIFPETQAICKVFSIDPWGLIASGSLLIVVNPRDADSVISSLSIEKIPCKQVGQIVPIEEGLTLLEKGKKVHFKTFDSDELTKVL